MSRSAVGVSCRNFEASSTSTDSRIPHYHVGRHRTVFSHRQKVPSIVHFNLAKPDLRVPHPFVPCSHDHVYLPNHLQMRTSSSSRTQSSLSGPSHVTISYKSSVGSPHIWPAACVHGLTSPPFQLQLWPPCAKVLRRTPLVLAAVTTLPMWSVFTTLCSRQCTHPHSASHTTFLQRTAPH